jgi:hypothetical protein
MVPRFLRPLIAGFAIAALWQAGGCVTDNRVTLESTDSKARLDARFPMAVYSDAGATGADIVLTDLTLDELDPATDPAALSGRIVRISMVMRPKPGATPIDPTAANATVQYLILSRGAIGLYSGGAFVNPGKPLGTWGSSTMTARIRGGTLRLTAANEQFDNRLGPARMEARFEALADDALVGRAGAKFDAIVAELYRGER